MSTLPETPEGSGCPTPLLRPALQRSQLWVGESSGMVIPQPFQQRLGRDVRVFLQPPQHIAPNSFEGIFTRSPIAGSAHTSRMGRTRLSLTPSTGQSGEEPVQAFAQRSLSKSRGGDRCQGRLSFPNGVRQRHRVQPRSLGWAGISWVVPRRYRLQPTALQRQCPTCHRGRFYRMSRSGKAQPPVY